MQTLVCHLPVSDEFNSETFSCSVLHGHNAFQNFCKTLSRQETTMMFILQLINLTLKCEFVFIKKIAILWK